MVTSASLERGHELIGWNVYKLEKQVLQKEILEFDCPQELLELERGQDTARSFCWTWEARREGSRGHTQLQPHSHQIPGIPRKASPHSQFCHSGSQVGVNRNNPMIIPGAPALLCSREHWKPGYGVWPQPRKNKSFRNRRVQGRVHSVPIIPLKKSRPREQ